MQNAKMEVHILEDGWMSLIRKKKKKKSYMVILKGVGIQVL